MQESERRKELDKLLIPPNGWALSWMKMKRCSG